MSKERKHHDEYHDILASDLDSVEQEIRSKESELCELKAKL